MKKVFSNPRRVWQHLAAPFAAVNTRQRSSWPQPHAINAGHATRTWQHAFIERFIGTNISPLGGARLITSSPAPFYAADLLSLPNMGSSSACAPSAGFDAVMPCLGAASGITSVFTTQGACRPWHVEACKRIRVQLHQCLRKKGGIIPPCILLPWLHAKPAPYLRMCKNRFTPSGSHITSIESAGAPASKARARS